MPKRSGDQVALDERKHDFTEQFRQVLILANEVRRDVEKLARMYSEACRDFEAANPEMEWKHMTDTGLNAACHALVDLAGELSAATGC